MVGYGWTEISGRPYSKSTCGAKNTDDDNDGCNDNYDGNFDDNDDKNDQKTYKYIGFWVKTSNLFDD